MIAPQIVNRQDLYIFSESDDYHSPEMQARLDRVDYVVADALFDYTVPDITGATIDVDSIPALTRAAGSGAGIQYVFTESAGRNPIFSAICCATRLNQRMQSGWMGKKTP